LRISGKEEKRREVYNKEGGEEVIRPPMQLAVALIRELKLVLVHLATRYQSVCYAT